MADTYVETTYTHHILRSTRRFLFLVRWGAQLHVDRKSSLNCGGVSLLIHRQQHVDVQENTAVTCSCMARRQHNVHGCVDISEPASISEAVRRFNIIICVFMLLEAVLEHLSGAIVGRGCCGQVVYNTRKGVSINSGCVQVS